MDITLTYRDEIPVAARHLPDWLLSHGIAAVTTDEAAKLIGVPKGQVRQRMAAVRARGRMVSPSRGLWVPVPPDRMEWGAPEPAAYLDALMAHLGTGYYVGWLSAAALHGASHQAPQVVQVAAGRHVADRAVGRSRLHFLTRGSVGLIPTARVASLSGMLTASTPGATMLDVAEDIGEAGGVDNAATVIAELAWENAGYLADVLTAAPAHSNAAVRRVGWFLDEVAGESGLEPLERLAAGTAANPSLLSPYDGRTSDVSARWMINVNRKVEPDL